MSNISVVCDTLGVIIKYYVLYHYRNITKYMKYMSFILYYYIIKFKVVQYG